MASSAPSQADDAMEIELQCIDDEMSLLLNDHMWIVVENKRDGDATMTNDPVARGEGDKGEAKSQHVVVGETAEEKIRYEKQALFLRYKLQKILLSRDQPPSAQDLRLASDYFTSLEGLQTLDAKIFRRTKIHKVTKAVLKLNAAHLQDDEFNLKSRSQALLDKWKEALKDLSTLQAAAV
ncbi:hypothetical protein B0H63DRAFT_560920 [Podospora didyma]|uniref:TFIIS N-terminal domain-containing protein n=1 Tax=Podospora didyma TaxID=330526 RepID=A0AAE0NGP7_9PEZI|nr:hypothetical protein B0H63DRAFT_560920 [Podospora didyma]